MKRFYLTLGAVFKNETWILKEWLEHYIAEGVEHFYLIDNDSTDDPRSILEPYIRDDVVTLFEDPKRWAQTELYNRYLIPHNDTSKWIMIVDLDEFVYARNSFETVSCFLRHCEEQSVFAVIIPWKMFGSSGHVKHPSDNLVVPHFLMRKHYDDLSTDTQDVVKISSKSIVQTIGLKAVGIHIHELLFPDICLPDLQKINNNYLQPISEMRLAGYNLHLNHYPVQSREFWEKIKMTRGSAATEKNENIRTWECFDMYDTNEFKDEELAQKHQVKNT